MKLSVDLSPLSKLLRRMSAQESPWQLGDSLLPPLDTAALSGRGIEIDLAHIEVTKDGLLSYQGNQVILYIREPKRGAERDTLLHTPEEGPKFHVADCKTLETMRAQSRFERYVVTNNKSGLFTVIARDPRGLPGEEVEARLKVCKNCLLHLSYKEYQDHRRGREIWQTFSLAEFFTTYESHFRTTPRHSEKTAPPPGYAEDWPHISKCYRESVGWRCERCAVSLISHKHLLHTHHVNGVTGDNRRTNLRALCIVCHSEQPLHTTLAVGAKHRALIESLRKQP